MYRPLLFLAGAGLLAAQPAFDVASVKPNNTGNPAMLFRPSPGRFNAENQTLQHLLMTAYAFKEFQIIGGPGWINTEHFDVTGTAQGNPGRDQMMEMLKALLRDRFKLVAHLEARQLPIYELTVNKGGLKIEPVECFTPDPVKSEPPPAGRPICGSMGWGNGRIDSTATTMQFFTDALSGLIGRSVVDKTGLSGWFPAHLKFAPDNAPPDTDLPSVFTAVQEQLGLKLESAKGPVEVLVIESAERPSAN